MSSFNPEMSQMFSRMFCKSKRVARGRAEAPAVFRKPTKPVKRTHGVPLAKCMAYLLRNTWPTKLEIFDKADFCRVQQIRTQIRNIRQACVKSTCISIANPAIVRAKDAAKLEMLFDPPFPPNAIRTPNDSTRTPMSFG